MPDATDPENAPIEPEDGPEFWRAFDLAMGAPPADGAKPQDAAERLRRDALGAGAHLERWRAWRSELLAQRPAPTRPPARVWERLQSRLLGETPEASATPATGVQRWKAWSAEAADAPSDASIPGLVRANAGGFEPIGIDGIEVRRLSVDPERRTATMLVRMAPGSAYPAHRHGGGEECYVLSGELLVGAERMRAGDYQRAPKGSAHPVQSTDVGCLLLIVSSQDDELVETPT